MLFRSPICYNHSMEYLTLNGIKSSRLALGLMRIYDKPIENTDRLIRTAIDIGVDLLDNADIYGGGESERILGKIIKADRSLRNKIVLQTKCGIASGMYDLSYKHIIEAVDGSLSRLETDTIDILLLHRPDTLMRPEEIAHAFDDLEKSGKVKAFGVSNFCAEQIDYLQSFVNQKLCANQMQLSPTYCPLIDYGINVNTPGACDKAGGTLEYCRKNNITLQAYGPMQCSFTDETGFFYRGAFTTEHARKKYFALNFMLEGLAQKYDTTPDAVALSWILTHPANMQVVVGTTNADRLLLYKNCCEVPLSAYEWYRIYEAAGHKIP